MVSIFICSLSVLVLMVDGVSTSAFQRHLSKTYHFLKNVMQFKMFQGSTKVGENSAPNLLALLAGRYIEQNHRDMPPDVTNITYFDDWPLVWKDFQRNGYATVYNDENIDYSLFHYYGGKRGFKQKPVDYFYHTFWNELNWYERKHGYDRYCFRNRAKVSCLA